MVQEVTDEYRIYRLQILQDKWFLEEINARSRAYRQIRLDSPGFGVDGYQSIDRFMFYIQLSCISIQRRRLSISIFDFYQAYKHHSYTRSSKPSLSLFTINSQFEKTRPLYYMHNLRTYDLIASRKVKKVWSEKFTSQLEIRLIHVLYTITVQFGLVEPVHIQLNWSANIG